MTLTAVNSIFAVAYVKDVYLKGRLFSSVLEMGLSSWRAKLEAEGLSFEYGFKLGWIYDLPMTYLYFAEHWARIVG